LSIVLTSFSLHRGLKSAAYGGAAGVAVLLFVSGLPRVRQDILQVSNGRFDCAYFLYLLETTLANNLCRRFLSSAATSSRRSTPPTT
jgi:hypothetical protein